MAEVEVDVIGLHNYHAFYIRRTGQQLLACLLLKNCTREKDEITGLMRSARIYFTGNCIRSPAMLEVLENEALSCKAGFPCSTLSSSSCDLMRTSSFARTKVGRKASPPGISATPAMDACKVLLSAKELRGTIRNFLCEDEDHVLVCDEMKTRGNGLGFRAIHNEGTCVALLYLLRDNILLMEQPLFGTHTKDTGHLIGPSASLYVLDVTVIQTFMGLSMDMGTVELAFKECHETGEQRGTLSYHYENYETKDARIFTASSLIVPLSKQ